MATAVARSTAPSTGSVWTVVSESMTNKTALKDWFKLVGYIGKWGELCNPNLPGKSLFAVGGDAKNGICTFEIPKSLGEVFFSFAEGKRAYKKIDSICRLSNNAGDFMKLLSRHFSIPYMKHIEGGSAAFTLVGAVNNAVEHVGVLWGQGEIQTDSQRNRCISTVISLISDLSYMVFGALAVAVWLGLLVIPAVAVLVPLSIALMCSFTNYYFTRLATLKDESQDTKTKINAQLPLPQKA
jgi:hypothetical protein